MLHSKFAYKCYLKMNHLCSRFVAKSNPKIEEYKLTQATKKRVEGIGGGCKGDNKEYIEVVQTYWAKYGVKPIKVWYELYCNGKEHYDPRFIPDPLWFSRIIPYFNNMVMMEAYADKGWLNHVVTGVKIPETIVKKIGGYYFDGHNDQIISRDEAVKLCKKEEHLIIKPYRGTQGKGIVFYDRDEESSEKIESIFDAFDTGFVVQRIVKQHQDLSRLNSKSLNTIRVLSFHFKNEVYILSSQLRIGSKDSRVDNVSSGGFACEIQEDGWLCEKAVNRQSRWIYETEAGFKFKDIRVPDYEKIVDCAKRLHCQLPYFNIVGWDFAVGEDGDPILIEVNFNPAQNQIGGEKPTFGDLSEEVFEDVFITKTLKNIFKKR